MAAPSPPTLVDASGRGFCIWSGNARGLNAATLEPTSNASFGPRTISQSQASTAPISRVACDHNKPNRAQGRENRTRMRPRKARRKPPWGRTIIMKRQEHFERIFERHPHRMHPVSGSRLPYHRPLHDPPIPSPRVGAETPYRDRLLVRVLPDVRILPRAAAASRRPHGVCRLRGDAAACSLQLRP